MEKKLGKSTLKTYTINQKDHFKYPDDNNEVITMDHVHQVIEDVVNDKKLKMAKKNINTNQDVKLFPGGIEMSDSKEAAGINK